MKNILKVLALMFAIGFSYIANAQLYNDEVCFFVWEENPTGAIYIVRFDGDKIYAAHSSKSKISQALSDDPSVFDNMDINTSLKKYGFSYHADKRGGAGYVYEYRLDDFIESPKTIYSDWWYAVEFNRSSYNNKEASYLAFPDDLSYVLVFRRQGDKMSNLRRKYVRISKDYFSPQSVNDDVLRLLEE